MCALRVRAYARWAGRHASIRAAPLPQAAGHNVTFLLPSASLIIEDCEKIPNVKVVTYDADKIAASPEEFKPLFTDLLTPAQVCVTLVRQQRGDFQRAPQLGRGLFSPSFAPGAATLGHAREIESPCHGAPLPPSRAPRVWGPREWHQRGRGGAALRGAVAR